MSTNLPASFRLVNNIPHDAAHPIVIQALRDASKAFTDIYSAIPELKAQIEAKASSTTTTIIQGGSSGGGGGSSFPGFGGVNDQTGNTAYTLQSTDNGILLILNDASPVAVTLNSGLQSPFLAFITNFGVGAVTLTPSSGTLTGVSTVNQGFFVMVVFDGTNWWTSDVVTLAQTITKVTHEWLDSYDATTGLFTQSQPDYSDLTGLPQLPNTKAPVTHEWLASYDATTGNFTQSQPDFSDVSGNLATSQLPTAGITVTITTAALTPTGAQGSMTFTGGILTAQTPAT